ncbi:MAG: hypothetical protein ACI4VW_09480 [Acutalibacteraceae bacterium]
MRKIIGIVLLLCCITVFAACGKDPADDGKSLETAESRVEVTGNAGTLTIDETTVRTLLEVFPKESLGLKEDLYEYDLKLSATRFSDSDACLAEAFAKDSDTAEGTFIILGQQCFVHDNDSQKYLLLTVDGAVEYEPSTSDSDAASTTAHAFAYDEENNSKLQEKFSSYGKKKLGLDKEISEYILVASGTTTTAENGETVYVIRLYEKDGEATNQTLAFNGNGNYVFDYEINRYVKL